MSLVCLFSRLNISNLILSWCAFHWGRQLLPDSAFLSCLKFLHTVEASWASHGPLWHAYCCVPSSLIFLWSHEWESIGTVSDIPRRYNLTANSLILRVLEIRYSKETEIFECLTFLKIVRLLKFVPCNAILLWDIGNELETKGFS